MGWQGDGPPLSSTGIVYKGSHRRFAEQRAYWEQERERRRLNYEAQHPEIQAARDEAARRERETKRRMEALKREREREQQRAKQS
jgi:hypothetical protein